MLPFLFSSGVLIISLLLPCKEFEFQSEIGIYVGCLTWSHYAILVSNGALFLSSHRECIFIELSMRHPLLGLFKCCYLCLKEIYLELVY
jgi:hypothetical protein